MTVRLNLERLRREMLLRGWSWQALSDEAGIARSTASKIALGTEVSSVTLARVARALQENPPPALAAELLT